MRPQFFEQHEDENENEIEIPSEFICPISQCIMENPMNVPNTPHNFDQVFILQWLEHSKTNPLTREHLTAAMLVPNQALKSQIDAYLDAQEPQSAAAIVQRRKGAIARIQEIMDRFVAKKKEKWENCLIL